MHFIEWGGGSEGLLSGSLCFKGPQVFNGVDIAFTGLPKGFLGVVLGLL